MNLKKIGLLSQLPPSHSKYPYPLPPSLFYSPPSVQFHLYYFLKCCQSAALQPSKHLGQEGRPDEKTFYCVASLEGLLLKLPVKRPQGAEL